MPPDISSAGPSTAGCSEQEGRQKGGSCTPEADRSGSEAARRAICSVGALAAPCEVASRKKHL